MRHASPFSTRSIVRTEIFARRASSALLNRSPSLTFRTLLGSTLSFSFPGVPTVFGSSDLYLILARQRRLAYQDLSPCFSDDGGRNFNIFFPGDPGDIPVFGPFNLFPFRRRTTPREKV